jgi:hypothetical protein
VITKKKKSTIQVALLSRYPIKKTKEIQSSYSPRVRNILEAQIEIEGQKLSVFVNHWKSRAYKGVESKRIKEAKALQKRIAKMPKNSTYVILGDLNSDYNAYKSLEKKLNDTRGKTAINDILKTKIGSYLTNERDMARMPWGVHYSLWLELPITQRWSYNFYGRKSSLDHIILPKTLFDAKGLDYVNNSFGVFKPSYLFTKKGYINRWQMKYKKHQGKGYSDHLPVYAYLDNKPYIPEKKARQKQNMREAKIKDLYALQTLSQAVLLKNVRVLFKRGNHAVIKQEALGRGMYLYGCAKGLKEGYRYDLRVESMQRYKGLLELSTAFIVKEIKPHKDMKNYYLSQNDVDKKLRQNEILREVQGLYKDKYFYVNGIKIPIFFKKAKDRPKNNTKLKIHYGHLGYYKSLQLVIYRAKDFAVEE